MKGCDSCFFIFFNFVYLINYYRHYHSHSYSFTGSIELSIEPVLCVCLRARACSCFWRVHTFVCNLVEAEHDRRAAGVRS